MHCIDTWKRNYRFTIHKEFINEMASIPKTDRPFLSLLLWWRTRKQKLYLKLIVV